MNKESVNGVTKEGVSKPDGEKKDTETKEGDADKTKTAEEKVSTHVKPSITFCAKQMGMAGTRDQNQALSQCSQCLE